MTFNVIKNNFCPLFFLKIIKLLIIIESSILLDFSYFNIYLEKSSSIKNFRSNSYSRRVNNRESSYTSLFPRNPHWKIHIKTLAEGVKKNRLFYPDLVPVNTQNDIYKKSPVNLQ